MSAQNGEQPQQLAIAFTEESFGCEMLNVIVQEAQPGVVPSVSIRFLAVPLPNGTFAKAFIPRLLPELAIQLGEHLVREGQRVKSGVVIPMTRFPQGLRPAG